MPVEEPVSSSGQGNPVLDYVGSSTAYGPYVRRLGFSLAASVDDFEARYRALIDSLR